MYWPKNEKRVFRVQQDETVNTLIAPTPFHQKQQIITNTNNKIFSLMMDRAGKKKLSSLTGAKASTTPNEIPRTSVKTSSKGKIKLRFLIVSFNYIFRDTYFRESFVQFC